MTICVVGHRRSGTSMMMLCLKEAGFNIIGRSLANEGNPGGYWETGMATRGTEYAVDGVVKVMTEAIHLCKYFDAVNKKGK